MLDDALPAVSQATRFEGAKVNYTLNAEPLRDYGVKITLMTSCLTSRGEDEQSDRRRKQSGRLEDALPLLVGKKAAR
jgi:hypothetical protein